MIGQKESPKSKIPSDMDLANYARAYVGAYMSAVQSEGSELVPMLARNHPYSIEVCYLPNNCFCLMFEKADRSSIAVHGQTWDYVMGKVMSGVTYLVTVYPHEGCTTEGAAAKGRRDAIRDIRTMESSDIVESTRQLEKVIDELRDVSQGNRNPLRMAESAMSKLEPIKQTLARSGPTLDIMSMIDAVKSYPPPTNQVVLDDQGIKLIETVVKELGSLQELVKQVKEQDARTAEVETRLGSELETFKAALDKKIAKGLGVILASTDRKIDKAMAAVGSMPFEEPEPEEEEEEVEDPRFGILSDEIAALKDQIVHVQALASEPPPPIVEARIPEELTMAQEQMGSELRLLSSRVKRIEAYLQALSVARKVSR